MAGRAERTDQFANVSSAVADEIEQATLSAHAKAKAIPAAKAIRGRVIAPWYMANNDATKSVRSASEPTTLINSAETKES